MLLHRVNPFRPPIVSSKNVHGFNSRLPVADIYTVLCCLVCVTIVKSSIHSCYNKISEHLLNFVTDRQGCSINFDVSPHTISQDLHLFDCSAPPCVDETCCS